MMAEDSSSKSGTRRGTLVTQMPAKPVVSPNPADVNRTARRRLVISSCGVLYQVPTTDYIYLDPSSQAEAFFPVAEIENSTGRGGTDRHFRINKLR
jgi:hypothetical protein